MEIEVVKDTNKFKDLKDDWDNLLEKSNSKSVFLTWEWLYYWWIHFKGDKELFILLVKNKITNQTLGIAPFCVQKIKLFHFIFLKKIKFLGTEKVASDFLDFIISPGLEDKVLKFIYEYLDKNADKWDIIEIGDVEEDSNNTRLLRKYVNGNYEILEQKSQICPYIKLPKDYELLLSSLSSKMRHSLKRQTKYLEEKDKMIFSINNEREHIRENINKLFTLHNDRFKSKKKGKNYISVSDFSGNKIKDFHYNVASSFLLRDWLRLYFLNYDRESIACIYAFKYKDRLFYYQSGFNSNWHKWSLGSVLLGYSIKDSIKERLNEFHCLRGAEAYKSKWTKTAKKTINFTLINNNLKSNLYASVVSNKIKLKKLLKKFI